MAQSYGTGEVYINLVPGNTLLFVLTGSAVPGEGHIVKHAGNRYRVQDILHDVKDIPAVPPDVHEGNPASHIARIQVEVALLP